MPRFREAPLLWKFLPDEDDPRPEIDYPLWARNFLPVLQESGNFGLSCDAAGIDIFTLRRYRYGDWGNAGYRGNLRFCQEVNGALDRFVEHLTLQGVKRAAKGSDRLMVFFLKSLQPDVYAPPRVVQHQEDPALLARVDDMRARLLAKLAPPPQLAGPDESVEGSYKEVG